MIAFQMTIATSHWIAYGEAGRQEFVNFVRQALSGDFIAADGLDGEQEAEDGVMDERGEVVEEMDEEADDGKPILPNERSASNTWDSGTPWFVYVVPYMSEFERAKIQKKIRDDSEFCRALTATRFFVMELPVYEKEKPQQRSKDLAPEEKASEVGLAQNRRPN
jgi:hypothetical protein